jgi:hypothetical protein
MVYIRVTPVSPGGSTDPSALSSSKCELDALAGLALLYELDGPIGDGTS